MILLQLFWAFFQIGILSFGGGMATLPLIQQQIVDGYGWLSMTEFTDLVTISQMTPGPIALNASTFVGTQVAGLPGALVATLGCVTPSCIIIAILAFIYFRYKELDVMQGILSGLRPAVVSLIAAAGTSIMILAFWGEKGFTLEPSAFNYISFGLFMAALFVLRKYKPNPIYVMAGCGVIGAVLFLTL